MSIVAFGDSLLSTGDLDPVYIALHRSKLDEPTTAKLCLAYWCFYSLGVAAHMAEIRQPKRFWSALQMAAANINGSWSRGAERRHFRGKLAIEAVAKLAQQYKTPEHAVAGMMGVAPFGNICTNFARVSRAVQAHYGFGPWIAFKIADMSERVLSCATDFNDCHLGIYKDPRQGASVALQEWQGEVCEKPWDRPITDDELQATVQHYVSLWRKKCAIAPPLGDRLVNVQEIETIFCKYKSHLKGHYEVGKDIREVGHGLEGWGDLAQELQRSLPVWPAKHMS